MKLGIAFIVIACLICICFIVLPTAYLIDAKLIRGEVIDWGRIITMFVIGIVFGGTLYGTGQYLRDRAKRKRQLK